MFFDNRAYVEVLDKGKPPPDPRMADPAPRCGAGHREMGAQSDGSLSSGCTTDS